MAPVNDSQVPRVAIVGGGLAGLAAAVGLAGQGLGVEVFESRRHLGGRAASFCDPATGETVDHCQHVSLGCCTNFRDFCRRTGLEAHLRRDRKVTFIDEVGRRYTLAASAWLPAPLHLATSLARLRYLRLRERFAVARTLWRLARQGGGARHDAVTAAHWLARQKQSPRLIEMFWAPILTSALGESPDRVSLAYARKVMVDGFLAAREAYVVDVPRVPLATLYDRILPAWLRDHGVDVFTGRDVASIDADATGVKAIVERAGIRRKVAAAIVAVPWTQAAALVPETVRCAVPELRGAASLGGAPISAIHLWFDRPITPLAHAVLPGRCAQWIFCRESSEEEPPTRSGRHYCQVVVSASRELTGIPRDEIVGKIAAELAQAFPEARRARLLESRIVTQRDAVFSAVPGVDRLRPLQMTAIANLALAGDWTRTGWPATMEGAVRSGYLAAEAILRYFGRPHRLLVPDLPRGWLARMLLGAAGKCEPAST